MPDPVQYPELPIARLTGEEVFRGTGAIPSHRLIDFWQWSMSDLANNSTRGVLAEFLVALALGRADGVRLAWDPYDLESSSGIKVEVKSSARWQSWGQEAPSQLQFGIRPTREWTRATNALAADPKRQADVYVFAVLDCPTKNAVNPLDLNQWEFHVVRAAVLDTVFRHQKIVSLAALTGAGAVRVGFLDLASTIDAAAHDVPHAPARRSPLSDPSEA